jgi:cytochrome c oxidase cbb3-type subunit 3
MSDRLALGERLFAAHCVSCHAADGSGMVGPNLTDDLYRNVKVVADLHKVIAQGAGNGAMPAWSNRLHPNEIVLLSSYVARLRGKNIPSRFPPILPPGEPIAPWPAAPPPPPPPAAGQPDKG